MQRLKVLSLNIWHRENAWDARREVIRRGLQALTPDLIGLQEVLALEGGGTKQIETRRHHELASVEGSVATIKVTYQVLSPIDAAIECQLVQRLMDGEVRFNMKSGRIVGQRMEIDKRILGFAGPTSSMQYIMLMEEKLLDAGHKVAANWPDRAPVAKSTSAETKTATRPREKEEESTIRR